MRAAFITHTPFPLQSLPQPQTCLAATRISTPRIRRSRHHQPPRCADNSVPASPKPAVSVQAALLLASTILWSLLCLPLTLLLSIFRLNKQRLQLTLLAMSFALKTSRIKVSINAAQAIPKKPCLIVSNHQSALDIFIVACLKKPFVSILPRRITSFPIVGWLFKLSNWIFLEGQDRRAQMDALGKVGEHLKTESVAVFPEGTPSETGAMRRFATPVFKMARKAGVDVLPVTVSGSNRLCDGPLPVRGGKVEVTVHPVITVDDDVTDKQVAAKAAAAIASALPEALRST